MRLFFVTISTLLIIASINGCSVHNDNLSERFPNLVQIVPPDDRPYTESRLIIESVESVVLESGYALHIQGNFPNPCTQLLRIEEESTQNILRLDLIGWQETNTMCAQYIVPFSYLYTDLNKDQWSALDTVIVNGNSFPLNAPE